VDAAGVLLLSDVVWDTLARRNISAEEFGRRFGMLTRSSQKPYTKSRIYQMLRENAFPEEPARRWVLATLLQIPPVLVGVTSLDELLELQREQKPMTGAVQHNAAPPAFDAQEYRATLLASWKHHRLHMYGDGEVADRIGILEQAYLYGPVDAKRQVAALLCGYHLLASNLATDLRDFDDAIRHLNNAYAVAKERKLVQLEGACVLRRGWAMQERGEEQAERGNLAAAREDFTFAARDFHLGLSLATKLTPALHGSLLLSVGKLHADQATDPAVFHQAIVQMEKAESFVGKKGDAEGLHFIQLDEERYHLDRAGAYLASANPLACYPGDARRELRCALAAAPVPIPQRRHAYAMILEAKSYVIEGQAQMQKQHHTLADTCYAQATHKATEALHCVRDIHSTINVVRIEHLYEQIQETPYAQGSVDVASLAVELMRAKHPHLFA
jgi:tetratricopeptide (TPR) repeat protein